ncbi:hypothetical protein NE237_001596 [Protea cynaroides]|uniref:ADP-ribosyl cyclase/cyclic ADP-ribose hydrolase n=1 Tax=Protea cynaroides TaxID=273540 RepID=A0A9Q0KTL7_9MAGN|nr:hypothetical protein NE237_001596 [Protea cynaroides]
MAELAQASSSLSSFGSSNFDVFLSYKWEDTGNNFTSFLYKTLNDSGMNVFRDSKKLWLGDSIGPAIKRAIKGSKIWILVFSSGFAESQWCLWELALIVLCHRSNGGLILPIFCHVNPYDVQHQTGSRWRRAFQKHEKKFKPDIVKNWKNALQLVGNLKGEILDGTKEFF